MASIVPNRGRLISNLNGLTTGESNDLIVIQDVSADETKKITITNLADSLLDKFTNVKLTGSLFVPFDGVLTCTGNAKFGNNYNNPVLSVTYVPSLGELFNVNTSYGTLTSVNGWTIEGNSTFDKNITVDGTINGDLIGSLTGSSIGDVYATDGTSKILENGTNGTDATFKGNVLAEDGTVILENGTVGTDAAFLGTCFGTSSYADETLSASYSLTSSYAIKYDILCVNADTASLADTASFAHSSSYLVYSPAISNGTASYAQRAAQADIAATAISTGITQTASYLLQDNDVVSPTALGMWDGTRMYQSSINSIQYPYVNTGTFTNYIDISSSLNQVVTPKQGFRIFGQDFADFWLVNTRRLQNKGIGTGKTHPNMDAVFLDATNNGAFGLKTFTGSYHVAYTGSYTTIGSGSGGCRAANAVDSQGGGYNGIVPMLKQTRNSLYFWPSPNLYSVCRDGAVGIGVAQPNNPTGSFDKYLRAKLQIEMFSGSNEGNWAHGGNPQVEHRSTAFMVRYLSGSNYPTNGQYKNQGVTCAISASGDAYFAGDVLVGGVFGSYSMSTVTIADSDPNGSYFATHNRPADIIPSQVRAVLVCVDSDQGWAVGDEVSVEAFSQSGNNNRFTTWADSDYAGVSWQRTSNWMVVQRGGGSTANIDESKWKIKIYYG